MRLIHRATTNAYSFVAMNWDQVAALVYLARGGEAGAERRQAKPEHAPQPETEGGLMRGMLILLGTGSVLALAGVPTPEPGWSTMFGVSQFVTASFDGLSTPIVRSGAALSESASLLVLAGGFFAAAVLVRRHG
jgi:hypothetical protein